MKRFPILVLVSATSTVWGVSACSGTPGNDLVAAPAADAAQDSTLTSDGSSNETDSATSASDAPDASALDGNDVSDGRGPCSVCDPRAACSFGDAGVVMCNCPTGYTTPDSGYTCVDIDECSGSANVCGTGTCRNVAGSYECTCPGSGCRVIYAASGDYAFNVPSSVSTIAVEVWGAGGGASFVNQSTGGGGGYAAGNVAVVAGTGFNIKVGAGGPAGLNAVGTTNAFGGGGAGGLFAAGGGGRSEVRSASGTTYLVGGGGGGGGYFVGGPGAAGGGSQGVDGRTPGCATGGLGGTQTAGGATGGASGTGGNATASAGGGGGGGYFGGGGAGPNCGGGGGSGFALGAAPVSATTLTAGSGTQPAATSRPTYGDNSGRGGNGARGNDGRVVITW